MKPTNIQTAQSAATQIQTHPIRKSPPSPLAQKRVFQKDPNLCKIHYKGFHGNISLENKYINMSKLGLALPEHKDDTRCPQYKDKEALSIHVGCKKNLDKSYVDTQIEKADKKTHNTKYLERLHALLFNSKDFLNDKTNLDLEDFVRIIDTLIQEDALFLDDFILLAGDPKTHSDIRLDLAGRLTVNPDYTELAAELVADIDF